MANRLFNAFNYTLEKATVTLFGDINIGAAGAPTFVSALKNKGLKSIVRNSAGNYTVTFSDQYVRLLSFWVGVIQSSGAVGAAPNQTVKTVTPLASGGATVNFVLFNGSTPTDPANGEELFIECTWSNSTTP